MGSEGEANIEASRIETVKEIAAAAGRHLMTCFRAPVSPRAKTRTSFVSEADETTERQVREALGRAFPGEAVLGEEFGLEHEPAGPWWVVDPIDGTSNFLAGLPLFSISIARMREGRAVLGVTHDPNTGETFHAIRGGGAFLDGRRLTMDGADRGALTMLAMRHSLVRRHPDLLSRLPTDKIRSLGSACLETAFIAAGRLHGVIARRINLWDLAAGALLIEEAGGLVHTAGGRPLFPLAHPPRAYVGLKIPLVAGTPRMVALLERLITLA